MSDISRRDFLKIGAQLGVMLGLGAGSYEALADAAIQLAKGQKKVLWLQGQACSGCFLSMLNTENPNPFDLITRNIALAFCSTMSAATGDIANDVMDRVIDEGDYILVVEGSIPLKIPRACLVNDKPFAELLERATRNAMKIDGKPTVISVGACAIDGGIPGAKALVDGELSFDNNPTGAIGVHDFLKHINLDHKLINIPGCPIHPDWITGTLVHLVKFGVPKLDDKHRPLAFFGKNLHEQCPLFADYEDEIFAEKFGDPGCLFNLGCLGPITMADCTKRPWNGGINDCIASGGSCIGCASEHFMRRDQAPFYTVNFKPNA